MADAEGDEGSAKREDVEEPNPPEEGGEAAAAATEGEPAAEEGVEVSGDVGPETEDAVPPAADEEGEGGAAAAAARADDGRNERVAEIPDTGEVAEIVLITTSLGSIRRQFFSSQRAKNFLDCKGVVYIIVDSNRDTSTAKNLRDVELFKEWKESRILKATPETEDSADPEIIIPQVLVDGVAVGSETTLQDLEEDGDLDWIFSRAACPNCLHEKPLDALQCESCGVVFRTLIPPDYITDGHVVQMLQGCPYNEDEAAAGEGGADHPPQQRWGLSSQQSIGADVEFGDFEAADDAAAPEPADAAARALQAAVKAEAEAEAAARRASGELAAAGGATAD